MDRVSRILKQFELGHLDFLDVEEELQDLWKMEGIVQALVEEGLTCLETKELCKRTTDGCICSNCMIYKRIQKTMLNIILNRDYDPKEEV